MKYTKVIVSSCFVGSAMGISLILYWHYEQDPFIKSPKIESFHQIENHSVVIAVPARPQPDLDTYYLSVKVMNLRGEVLRRTNPIEFSVFDNYKIVTSSTLPLGTFSVKMVIEYQLNPVAWRAQEFLFAKLHVDPKLDTK